MAIIKCACGSPYRCTGCDSFYRANIDPDPFTPQLNEEEFGEIQEYLRSLKDGSPYRTEFPLGPRGGALVTLAPLLTIECFLPFEANDGELLAWVPMAFLGYEKVHDLATSDYATCARDLCKCAAPVGWHLPRAAIRAIAGWSDAVLNERSGDLPGRLPTHAINVDTVTFMREVIFGDFRFPARAVSRATRRARNEQRGCKPPRPTSSRGPRGR